jgi:hypothetical protein
VPNLKTDRTTGVAFGAAALNVRRLMYQTLICAMDLRDHARRLGTALDPEDMQGPAYALIDRMRRYAELDRDFLGGQMLVDKQQGIELALAESGNAPGNCRIRFAGGRRVRPTITAVIGQIVGHQHEWLFTAKDEIRQSAVPLFEQ